MTPEFAHEPDDVPLVSAAPKRRGPAAVVRHIGERVVAGVALSFLLVIAACALGFVVIALRAVWWATMQLAEALGV